MRALHYYDDGSVPSNLPRIPIGKLNGHIGPVSAISFTLDGKHCLTGGGSSDDRSIKLWNPFRIDPSIGSGPGGGITRTSTSTSSIRRQTPTFQSGPSNNPMDDVGVDYDDLPTAFLIQTYKGGITHEISALCVATNTVMLATSHRALVVTDMVQNKVLRRLGGGGDVHTGRINSVASAHNGDVYLTASYDATVAIWDGKSRDTKPIQILRDAKDSVTDVYVSQRYNYRQNRNNDDDDDNNHNSNNNISLNSAIIRTSSVDGIIRSYDLRMGMLVCDDLGSPITSICPTHDDQCLVASCLDGTIRLIETTTTTSSSSTSTTNTGGELLNTYHSRHVAGQYSLDVRVLADDATIITGSEDGNAVLYDIVRANPVQVLETGGGRTSSTSTTTTPVRPVCTVAAHPKQSDVVILASYDNSVTVWANNHKKIHT